jgi:signal transduction histidine kinase
MDTRRRRRQILLLFFAIVIPAVVLITLAVRVVRQEAELSEKKLIDERRVALDQVRRELAARLQAIKLQEVNRLLGDAASGAKRVPEAPVVFVAQIEGGRMILPWTTRPKPSIRNPDYDDALRDGESLEFAANDPARAATAYRRALVAARTKQQQCAAQLMEARASHKSGQAEGAAQIYRSMLEQCGDEVDDEDMSFGLYAAERLLAGNVDVGRVEKYVLERARSPQWYPPVQASLLYSMLEKLPGNGAAQARSDLSAYIREAKQITTFSNNLQSAPSRFDFPAARAFEPPWLVYGDEPWLYTMTSPSADVPPVILVVSAKKISPPGVTLLAKPTETSTPIGEGSASLHVVWAPDRFVKASGVPVYLYAAGLTILLLLTVLAGYLVLRDVDREVQVAEMRSHFVASVSHELKTPLTAIRMFAETLAMGRSTNDRARAEYLQTIVSESERLSRLVDNVLDFSRIERGNKIYRMQPTSLADVVRSAARTMEYPLVQQGFTLTIKIDDTLPVLMADADAIEQAILNLLTNAMKYSGDARKIELRLGRAGHEAAIDVTDQGFGIAREDQKRIFEKFYRVRSPRTDLIAGTGLGLTLVTHIVKAHGGRLEVTSTAGQGSTFSVRLPLTASGAGAPA